MNLRRISIFHELENKIHMSAFKYVDLTQNKYETCSMKIYSVPVIQYHAYLIETSGLKKTYLSRIQRTFILLFIFI